MWQDLVSSFEFPEPGALKVFRDLLKELGIPRRKQPEHKSGEAGKGDSFGRQ